MKLKLTKLLMYSVDNLTSDQLFGINVLTTKQNVFAIALIHLCEAFSAKIFS